MRKIVVFILFSNLCSCSLPGLAKSPLEFLSLFRFFSRTNNSEFNLGGAVSGLLSGGSVTITNASDSLTITSDGSFVFPTKFKTGTTYKVSISTAGRSDMSCQLASGEGTFQTSNITNVNITCGFGAGFYEVGVSVSGITASLSVQNNGTDTLTFSTAALHKFTVRIKTGVPYAVTISSQTAGSVCAFDNPSLSVGTMGTTNVTVFIRCIAGYANGGAIHNVTAADLFSNLAAPNYYLRTMVGSYPLNAGGGGVNLGTADSNTNPMNVRFNSPKGMVSDGTYVYVADYDNNRIRRIDKSNGHTDTFAGGALLAGGTTCPGVTTTNCLDGTGTAANFNQPIALTTDGTSLYVLEFLGNRIRRINLATAQVTTLAGNGNTAPFSNNANGILATFSNPHAITLHNGTLYVSDRYNNRIRAVNPITGAVTTFAGTGTPGFLDANGTSAQFDNPIGIVSLGGYLYVTDAGNSRIRRIDTASPFTVTTIAGQATLGSLDGYGTNSQFSAPFWITTDGTNLIISEYDTYRLRHIRISDAKVTTLSGGFVGYEDNAAMTAQVERAAYVTSDGLNLYFSEEANHAIRRLENAELLRYTFDGNANDSIGTNHGTLNGSPTLTTDENGTASGAYEFNGTTDYISSSANVNFSGSAITDNLTISAWIFPSGTGSSNQFIFFNGTNATDGYGLEFLTSTRDLRVKIGAGTTSSVSSRKLPLNQWSHVALTRNNGSWQIHINGISEAIVFAVAPVLPTVGFKVSYPGNEFKGKISDVRFFKGALDSNSIQKLAIQVPNGLLAYYPLNDNTNDYSGNDNHLTLNGAPTQIADRNAIATSAYSFIPPNDYLEKLNPYGLPTGNASRTTCAWVRATTTPSNVVSFGTSAPIGSGNGLAIGASAILHYGMTTDHPTNHFYLQNRWVHICGTYDGAISQIYYNGSFRNTTGISWVTGTSPTLRIGRRMDGGEFFQGQIDDVRIYNRVLSQNEIQAISGSHPLQISGLQLHLQASSLTASPVTAWLDNSPNNTTALSTGGNSVTQGTAGLQPGWSAVAVNATPGLTFNNLQFLKNETGTYYGLGTSRFSFFLVNSRYSTGSAADSALSIGPLVGGKVFLFDDASITPCGNTYAFSILHSGIVCAAQSTTGFSVTNQQRIFSLTYDDGVPITNPFFWDNNAAQGSTITPNVAFSPPSGLNGIYVGSMNGGGNPYDGVISEIIYFDRVLTTTEANSVRCYLSRRYKIPIGNTCP